MTYPYPTVSTETGYWTGSITYSPSWSAQPLSVSIGTGPDANGIAWIWERIEGWDSPDVIGQVLQRGADHGGWPAGAWFAPRALTLQLRASAPTQALRDVARAQLQQLLPVSDLALLQYNEPVPKQMYVRRAGKVTETYDNTTEVDFACVLVAPDPRKYSQQLKTWPSTTYIEANYTTVGSQSGATWTTLPWTFPNNVNPGTTAAINAGNFETRPVIFINGPLHAPGVMYQNTGQRVTFSSLTLNTGDVLMIDFDARMAYRNPSQQISPGGPLLTTTPSFITGYTPADINSAWFVLQPGFNSVQLLSGQFVVTDTGQMTVLHRDAYI